MWELLWILSPLFFLGLPGLVAGVLLGRWRKSWKAVLVLVALGFLLDGSPLVSFRVRK
jgi:hypothetical protein